MADWKQITARIRRARTGKDPASQLTALFSKTHDAMVAFELARYLETAGNPADAGRWYLTAAERFRRADWKTKAQESATRLGATEPAEIPPPPPPRESPAASNGASSETPVAAISEPEPIGETTPVAETGSAARQMEAPKHRRGRRRGRDRQRGTRRPEQTPAEGPQRTQDEPAHILREETPAQEERSARAHEPRPVDAPPATPGPNLRGRSGDPGLASRLTQLEMNFRRLLSSAPMKLEDGERAPAGPGVWLLTDSDLTTYYYVEACQTLRVAIPLLLRGGTPRGGTSIKPQLAEYLGIPQARVAKYLGEHCVVRWLQLDDGASHFAHFLVAVLHPALNE